MRKLHFETVFSAWNQENMSHTAQKRSRKERAEAAETAEKTCINIQNVRKNGLKINE